MAFIIICPCFPLALSLCVGIKKWKERERARERGRNKLLCIDQVLSVYDQPTTKRENVVVIGAPYLWGALFRIRFTFSPFIYLFIPTN